jgi:peptidyl-prolyl cis-trans isomerase B (cyclophilin B)
LRGRRGLYLFAAALLVAVIVVPTAMSGSATTAVATPTVLPEDASPTPTTVPPVRSWASEPEHTLREQQVRYTAFIQTSKGIIRAELFAQEAPRLANSFVFLANQRYFDNQKVNAVVPSTRVDMGAANPDGTGGPGYSVPLSLAATTIGSLAMVPEASGGAGSRFAIITASQAAGNLGVFGRVIDGLDIARSLTTEDSVVRVAIETVNLAPPATPTAAASPEPPAAATTPTPP